MLHVAFVTIFYESLLSGFVHYTRIGQLSLSKPHHLYLSLLVSITLTFTLLFFLIPHLQPQAPALFPYFIVPQTCVQLTLGRDCMRVNGARSVPKQRFILPLIHLPRFPNALPLSIFHRWITPTVTRLICRRSRRWFACRRLPPPLRQRQWLPPSGLLARLYAKRSSSPMKAAVRPKSGP